jgi:hypothetical protein
VTAEIMMFFPQIPEFLQQEMRVGRMVVSRIEPENSGCEAAL